MNDDIKTIESLYPVDSRFHDTACIGQELLKQAIVNTNFNWRNYPPNVLQEYAYLCMKEEKTGLATAKLKLEGKLIKL